MENKTSYPVKKSFCISGPNLPKGVMAFLFFIIAIQMYAQPYSACFSLSPAQVCPGQAVTFTDCSMSPSGVLHTGDGTNLQLDATVPSTTHSYSTPGVYNSFQLVNNGMGGNSVSSTKTVTVVDNTPSPTFTVSKCEGNLVTVNITDTHYDVYNIAWGDGNTGTASPGGSASHTYAATSTYVISVTGAFTSASCTSLTSNISVMTLNALMAPAINDLTVNSQQLNSGSITLRFSTVNTQYYQIEEQQGGGGYTNALPAFQGSGGTEMFTFTNLHTSVDPYYYRVYTYDDCGTKVYSDDIYSAVLNGTATNNQNNISWFDYHTFLVGNFLGYELFRDGVSVFYTNTNTNTYTDLAVTCQQTYQYQVVTYTTAGTAYSAFIPVTAISTDIPTTLQNPNVSVINGQTMLTWDYPTSGFTPSTYTIQRADNGGPYLTVGSTSGAATQYFDFGSSPGSNSMCYQINYTDVCNNNSAYSVNTCPVLLQMSSSTTTNTLTWSSYTGYYASGIQGYEVEVLDENGSIIRTIPVGMSFTTTDPIDPSASIMRYRIRVIPNGSENLISYSNIVEISFAPQLHIPTAFTPNADGNNDKFEVKGRYLQEFQMTVFNQWGQAVFFSEDPSKGWDGTFNGEVCGVDDYAWVVKAKDNSGNDVIRKGTVSLIR